MVESCWSIDEMKFQENTSVFLASIIIKISNISVNEIKDIILLGSWIKNIKELNIFNKYINYIYWFLLNNDKLFNANKIVINIRRIY